MGSAAVVILNFVALADAADPTSIRAALKTIRSQMGPIAILHWNAYDAEAGDLLTADPQALQRDFNVSIFGLLAATNEVLADLRAINDGAILVSTGGLGEVSPEADQAAVALHMEGLALASAAKHKLVGLLAQSLKAEGGLCRRGHDVQHDRGHSRRGSRQLSPSVHHCR
jgi:NAD(P)-dependent dehydrogenase (short-subunit alcohol dehydrogenase family)